MPNDPGKLEYRVRESWRVRACAAGLCVGAQIYLFGCGIAMPIALNSAWIASLAALPMAALLVLICRRALAAPPRAGAFFRALYALLALTLFANAAFALSSLVSFAEQTLLQQSRVLWSTAVALAAIALCAIPGGTGVSRLCFALRWALPLLLLALSLASLPLRMPVGLFPILGAGALPLSVAALCMLGAASPVLLLLLPPPELARAGEEAQRCPPPSAGYFLARVLLGALVGVGLLFAASVCSTYESIAENGEWGSRLHLIAGERPHEGILQTMMTLVQMIAIVLLAVSMLCAGEQALCRMAPKLAGRRAGLLVLVLLLALCMAGLIVFGFAAALFAAPGLIVPTAILLIYHKRLGAAPA